VESKAEILGCSHSTARVSNAAIREKVRAMNAKFYVRRVYMLKPDFNWLQDITAMQQDVATVT
jgi:hypothetical protein